jgi:hypothetical protein
VKDQKNQKITHIKQGFRLFFVVLHQGAQSFFRDLPSSGQMFGFPRTHLTPAARGKTIIKSATIVGDMAHARIGHTPFHAQVRAAGVDNFWDAAAFDWLGDDDVEHSEAPAEAAAAVLVARGPARAGRRNAQFKAEVCAAFNTIGLDAGSCLPPTHVPARDPNVLSASHHQDEHARRPPGLSRA